jgi:hypothetical protein
MRFLADELNMSPSACPAPLGAGAERRVCDVLLRPWSIPSERRDDLPKHRLRRHGIFAGSRCAPSRPILVYVRLAFGRKVQPEMKKPSSRIREEIAALQEQLRAAETREAERIGRLALKAGLGDLEIDDTDLVTAFEELAGRFRKGNGRAARTTTPAVSPGTPQGSGSEA